MPFFFQLVLERGTDVSSPFKIWRIFSSLCVRPAGTLLFDFCSPFPSTWAVVFVSRRQVCYSVSPRRGDILLALVTILIACAPHLTFLHDFAELCVDVPFVAWLILAPGLGG